MVSRFFAKAMFRLEMLTSEFGEGIISIEQNYGCWQIARKRVWPVNQIEVQGVVTNTMNSPKVYFIVKSTEIHQ